MTRFLLVTLGVLLSLVSASETRAQSQLQMNRAASKDLRDAEAEMTRVLALLFKMAESKPRALAKLKQAQSLGRRFAMRTSKLIGRLTSPERTEHVIQCASLSN